jgi:Leucine-rich repeat (LRR) protein
VDLPNPNLEAVIRETMRRPTGDIYQSDLTGLTVLVAGNTGIIDLSGLEYCTSLSTLSLYANQISDTVALSGLTGLTYCGHKQRKRMEG